MVGTTNDITQTVSAAADGTPSAFDALIAALGRAETRRATLAALIERSESRLWTHLLEFAAHDAASGQHGPALDEERRRAGSAIASAFAAHGDHAGAAAQRRALQDGALNPDAQIRAYTAALLGRRGDEAAIHALEGLLRDGDDHVRAAAARALVDAEPDDRVLTLLIGCLTRFDIVAAEAVHALAHVGVRAVPPLLDELGNPNPWARWHAIRALADIGDARALAPLLDLLDDADAGVRWEAAKALSKLGPPVIDPLLHALAVRDLTPWFAEGAARILRRTVHGDHYGRVAPLEALLRQTPVPVHAPIEAARVRAELQRSLD